MEDHVYAELAAIEGTHWWYRARREILHAIVDAELATGARTGLALDLGCGTGANFEVVARCGEPVAVDASRLALTHAGGRGGCRHLIQADARRLPLQDASVAWVFALDVLEHLDDDAAAREIHRVLRSDGRAVITVPAFPALWGAQDEAAQHRRRYTRAGLKALLVGAGLEVRRLTFINSALFLPILIVRRTARLLGLRVESENMLHPAWANVMLERVFAVEAHIVPRRSLPFGASLLCVAARPRTAGSPS